MSGSEKKKVKGTIWNAPFVFLVVCSTSNAIAFYMVNPLLSQHIVSLGFDLGSAGVVVGLFSGAALFSRPISGMLADRYNKKYILAGTFLITGICTLGFCFASQLILLALVRILQGFSFGMSSTVNISLAVEFIPEERMGEGLGYLSISNIIAAAIGPNCGLFFQRKIGIISLFVMVSVILSVGACLLLALPYRFVRPPKEKFVFRFRDFISFKAFPYALLTAVFSFSSGTVSSFLVLVGAERRIENISLYFTVNAIMLFLVRFVIGKASDRVPLQWIVCPALLLVGAEALLLGRAPVLWMVLLASVLKAAGQGVAQPALQSACIRKLGSAQSGLAISTYYIGADIGQGIGPVVSGFISECFGYGAMFSFAALLSCAAAVLYWMLHCAARKRTEVSQTE